MVQTSNPMLRIHLLLIFLYFLPFTSNAKLGIDTNNCEQITKAALDRLVPMLVKNNYKQMEPVLASIESQCGQNEFTQRLRILTAILEQSPTQTLITDYYQRNYQETLVMRWDYSIEEEYVHIYQNNKADFDHVPLGHPIDSLIKQKAEALLQSSNFNLSAQERIIMLLFADDINAFYNALDKTAAVKPVDSKPVDPEPKVYTQNNKDRSAFTLYAGIETALTGSDPVFKTNPILGFMFSSKLTNPLLYELGLKIRINSNDKNFDYLLYDELMEINSSASYSFGGSLGYKIFDNDDFIIYPKLGLYWESTATGLSENSYIDYWTNPEDYASVKYNNVNTMRSSIAIAAMHHLGGKKYIGLEAAYSYVPYNWDNNLLTSIQPNYGSLQVFFRF